MSTLYVCGAPHAYSVLINVDEHAVRVRCPAHVQRAHPALHLHAYSVLITLYTRSPAAGDRAARVSRASACGGRASGRGRAVRSQRRCALSRQPAVRPGGSALISAPLSRRRRAAELVGDGRAGRAHPRGWPHSGTCARTAARLRALRSTCAAQCNGAGGHHEGKVWRRRRRALGWAQGVCRAGRTVGGSTSLRDSWEGPADGNASSAPKTAWHARKAIWGSQGAARYPPVKTR